MLIRPRLTDYYDLPVSQDRVDFAIPFLDEDIPLFVDPFLLWKSPSIQEQSLHTAVIASFNAIGQRSSTDYDAVVDLLIRLSECEEVGLGVGKSREGRRIGKGVAREIIRLFRDVPDIERNGIGHIELLQMFVEQISKDRISDFTCGFLKSYLIDYTIVQAERIGIPCEPVALEVYRYDRCRIETENVAIPRNPVDGKPMLLVPKRWLRAVPWISFDDYFAKIAVPDGELPKDRAELLTYNRQHFGAVAAYVHQRERLQADCQHDPLFTQIPVISAKRRLASIKKLPAGKDDNADKKYEDAAGALLASLLYPELDFAAEQVRTESGVLIRDMIFYNSRSVDFLSDIYAQYGARQLIFELKNVKALEREHVNQLNRYLNEEFGRFGVFVTRNDPPASIRKSLVDLWSGQRRSLLVLTDADLDLMVSVFDSKQRLPIEVLKRAYVKFTRSFPG
jgi:hypothetical protein